MKGRKNTVKIIDDFFHDRIRADEVEIALRKLSDEEYPKEIGEVMLKHWTEKKKTVLPGKKEFDIILDKIHHRINLIEEEKIRHPYRNGKPVKKAGRIYQLVAKIAAVLFFPLLFTTSYFLIHNQGMKKVDNISYNEIYTPMSAQTRFLLPDSTVVWLNSASTLRYPLSFTGKIREVFLTGEGYFEVVKNPKKPFVVQTKKINVTAYGTSFDVMAYPDDPKVAATLVRGKIKVVKRNTGKYFILEPSSQAVLDTVTGKMTVSKVETRFYTSWKDGKLIFKSEPMEIVVHKLERWFNCKIHIQNDQLREYKYTGTIEMETLREVMELIKITTPIKYKYNKDTREIWIEPI